LLFLRGACFACRRGNTQRRGVFDYAKGIKAMKCQDCKFWIVVSEYVGECRIAPPIQGLHPWPITESHDFCGQFQLRLNDSLATMAEEILSGSEFTIENLKGRDRHQDIHTLRVGFVRKARQHGFSYSVLARFLNRDHGTIIHLDKESKV